MKAARARQWGGPEVLEVDEVSAPALGPDQVRVHVQAFSLNLADVAAFASEQIAGVFGLALPSGIGNDFAGVVAEVGTDVTGFAVGDPVFGSARARAGADYVVVTPQAEGTVRSLHGDELYQTPKGLDPIQASTIQTAGLTADAAVTAAGVGPADTVLIGGAAGGVGSFAVQLAKLAGARVIGTSSEATFDFLRELGAEPVAYGEGLVERVRELAPDGITAALDLFGTETARAAQALGVPNQRIAAVAARDPEITGNVAVTGALQAPADSSQRLAQLLASEKISVPIAATYPLTAVAGAASAVLGRHTHGKIVVTV